MLFLGVFGHCFQIVRYALQFQVFDDFFDFLVGYEWTMHTLCATTASHVEHVTHAKQLFGTHFTKNGAGVDLRGYLEGHTGREVCLDGTSDHIDRWALCCHDQMDTCSTGHLCQTLDGAFDVLACDHHQVGHFVDDDDNIWHRLEVQLFLLVNRVAGFRIKAGLNGAGDCFAFCQGLAHAIVEAINVTDAHLGHMLVALFHLTHGPFQGHDSLGWIGHNWCQQMRDAVIDGQFQHFGIDHDQAALFWRMTIEQRHDRGVDRYGLTRTGGTCDQNVRHASQIGNDRVTTNIFAEANWQLGFGFLKVRAG